MPQQTCLCRYLTPTRRGSSTGISQLQSVNITSTARQNYSHMLECLYTIITCQIRSYFTSLNSGFFSPFRLNPERDSQSVTDFLRAGVRNLAAIGSEKILGMGMLQLDIKRKGIVTSAPYTICRRINSNYEWCFEKMCI